LELTNCTFAIIEFVLYDVSMHIVLVVGTRPEAIKLAPLAKTLSSSHYFETTVIATGQHPEAAQVVFGLFGTQVHRNLNVFERGQDLNSLLSKSILELSINLKDLSPDIVIAQGDTSTTLAASLSAFNANIPFMHIEAGLRTSNPLLPFPEEMNRRLITTLSTFHATPTLFAKSNLIREFVDESRIINSGNTGIDATRIILENSTNPKVIFKDVDESYIVVTLHRRESWDHDIEEIVAGILDFAKANSKIKLVFILHPNPQLQEKIIKLLPEADFIVLLQPLNYEEMLLVLRESIAILTDSGGIQEEAVYLRKKLFVARNETERTEGVEVGLARLVGTSREGVRVGLTNGVFDENWESDIQQGTCPYGDGYASERIVQFLQSVL